jgi:branched-chain amino acid transport system ATP-binding protein
MGSAASGTGAALLEVRRLVKDFEGLRAVDHCSFSVREGTITGLIGPNGAGKTTLFNVITGFYQPDSGQVLLGGEDVTGLTPDKLFAKGLCRTFQIPREHLSMSVLENLMLVAPDQLGESFWNCWFRPGEVRRQEEEIRARAMEVLRFVDLTHVADEYAGKLSGGQKKLLELARTLMTEPKIVLLDEPAAGVNRTLLNDLLEAVGRLRDAGKTVLLVEHDMKVVMGLCETVFVLDHGEKIAEGPPGAIQTDERVIEAYFGR